MHYQVTWQDVGAEKTETALPLLVQNYLFPTALVLSCVHFNALIFQGDDIFATTTTKTDKTKKAKADVSLVVFI